MTTLFSPLGAGAIDLANRVVMAPMTRSRADDAGIVSELTATYYAQRASAGLIISEGLFPSAMGKGYFGTPGIHTAEQAAAWRRVTDAVHAKGGRMVAQVMHAGRISDPSFLPGQATPVAPSAVRPEGQSFTAEGMKPHVTPRELRTDEIPAIIAEYKRATELAFEAGFDGVELHAASGYLPEQFLSSKTNQRTDAYGQDRALFILEALRAMVSVKGAERVGIKIAPEMGFNDIADDTPVETYTALVERIRPLGLAYLHVALFGAATDYHALLKPRFGGAYLAGGGLTGDSATALLQAGKADAAVFGKPFIANPDLVERLKSNAALAEADPATFYGGGAQGYVDYPALVAA